MRKMMHALYHARWTNLDSLLEREGRHSRMLERQSEIETELACRLTEKEKALFEEYTELTETLSHLPLEKEYIRGFQDGIRLLANSLHPSDAEE